MEKATSTLRRSGAFLLSFGTGYQELNLILSDLKSLKSQVKAVRDSQQTVLQDITNWTCVEENRALQELFLHLSDLNALWGEVQTEFAAQIAQFRHMFEMILEGERNIDSVRSKFTDCELQEQKARKKKEKLGKKLSPISDEFEAAEAKLRECERQKIATQHEMSDKVKENEAVKFIRVKEGLLKLTEAYLALSKKSLYIYEAQRDIVKILPDVQDRGIHEFKFDGLSGAKDIIQRARTLVNDYRIMQQTPSQNNQNTDPPPPYSPNLYYSPPFNPYYLNPGESPQNTIPPGGEGSSSLYPSVRNE